MSANANQDYLAVTREGIDMLTQIRVVMEVKDDQWDQWQTCEIPVDESEVARLAETLPGHHDRDVYAYDVRNVRFERRNVRISRSEWEPYLLLVGDPAAGVEVDDSGNGRVDADAALVLAHPPPV
jgi:hypothetical protein